PAKDQASRKNAPHKPAPQVIPGPYKKIYANITQLSRTAAPPPHREMASSPRKVRSPLIGNSSIPIWKPPNHCAEYLLIKKHSTGASKQTAVIPQLFGRER